ncbi:PucR family transcriptional regulator [Agromyces lapidis]|uniref:PucR family transcriptional regulator n=1 Tax=Agromyces lapidis TaxID=279574 RepID=UPI0012F822BF|nr:PucR family transcriptional regulator [Agromyces lapidis]
MFDTVQETVDRLAMALNRSVVLEDAEFVLLASSAHYDDLDPARLQTLTARCPTEALAAELRARRLHARLAITLRSRYGVLGFLWVTLVRPLTPSEASVIAETVETLRSLLVNVSQSIEAVNAEVESEMLGLLTPDAPSRSNAASELVDLGMYTRSRRFVALCLSLGAEWAPWGGPPPREVISRVLLRAITTPMIDAYSFVPSTPDTFILIGFRNEPTPEAIDSMVAAIVREADAADVHEPLDAVVGIGAPVDGLADAWESYEQALVAVRVARSRGRRSASWTADPIAASVATLLAQEPPPHLLPDPLRRLAAAPPETIELFEAYVAHGERITEVAEQLGVHRATVHYRLKRAAASIGIDIDADDARFVIGAWLRQRWLRG